VTPNHAVITSELSNSWEVLAEPIQTVMRRFSVPNAYEKLKSLTRGHAITREDLHTFIHSLAPHVPEEHRLRLLELTPETYIGLAAQLARGEL
jgi:adenylosuccinate lyase